MESGISTEAVKGENMAKSGIIDLGYMVT